MEDRIMGFFDPAMMYDMLKIWINVVILCVILALILYNPVKNFLKARREGIQRQIETAEHNLQESDRLKADYEAKLREIDKERTAILNEARNQALKQSDEMMVDARHNADLIRNRATQDVEREKEQAKDEMRKQLIEISSLMASRYITANMDQATQSRLLEEAIADLGEAEWLS